MYPQFWAPYCIHFMSLFRRAFCVLVPILQYLSCHYCTDKSFSSLSSACGMRKYGVNCKFTCHCGGQDCNSISGECFCEAGTMGQDCAEGEN